jgi:hypothetical protein
VPVAVGLFGLSEILLTAGDQAPAVIKNRASPTSCRRGRSGAIPPGRSDAARARLSHRHRSRLGAHHLVLRLVRGRTAVSKHPERFGHGAIEGVAGPESANNSATSGAFVPMLALGVPSGPIPAVMLARSWCTASPRAAADSAAAGALLGLHRQHVRRQRSAADPEPAAGRAFREHSPRPLSAFSIPRY